MKSLKLIFLFAVVISLSCKKATYQPVAFNPAANPTSYVLISQQYTSSGIEGMVFNFSYNDQHLVSKMERYEWVEVTIGSNPPYRDYDSSYFSFEYADGLCSKVTATDQNLITSWTYTYNADRLPLLRTGFIGGQEAVTDLYGYDSLDNMVSVIDSSSGQINHIYTFTYNSDHNMTSASDYIPSYQELNRFAWTAFDTKVNFIKAINGYPPTYFWDNGFDLYSSSSPNNALNETQYFPTSATQPLPMSPPVSGPPFSYTYNDEGLPLTMDFGTWKVTNVYMKYK
jgi:hypothetical protein